MKITNPYDFPWIPLSVVESAARLGEGWQALSMDWEKWEGSWLIWMKLARGYYETWKG